MLTLDGGRVVPRPHPVLDRLRDAPTDTAGPQAELLVRARGPFRLDLGALMLVVDRSGDGLRLLRPGRPEQRMPLGATREAVDVRVILDASVAEVFTPAALAGLRIEPVGQATVPAQRGATDVVCFPLSG